MPKRSGKQRQNSEPICAGLAPFLAFSPNIFLAPTQGRCSN
ncbi:hypothetical protein D082_29430 [Synechocystis sp. PCC 6714]|nr:hypothetical protein D082_29430 [Synechocystis sp. PCC 6714]